MCSPTLISHDEAGRRLPKPDDAHRLDIALKTDGFFVRWMGDLDSKFARYFAVAAELEREATEIRPYAASLIPGLLRTEAYARAVFHGISPQLLHGGTRVAGQQEPQYGLPGREVVHRHGRTTGRSRGRRASTDTGRHREGFNNPTAFSLRHAFHSSRGPNRRLSRRHGQYFNVRFDSI
ncbi:Scr1 family TA system antitoxin-like transcriptional regulator [Streptomyces sp. NPDC056708]|uniref:Scr1 family TA system antitoxin-like transcriptional regulator n=1 Tax=unclassified Streptomyces TaxID=2593676 RepID=UPI00369BBF1D